MKNLRTTVLCAVFAISCSASFAQEKSVPINEPDYNRPKLFTGMPEKIQLSTNDIEGLFDMQTGRAANLNLPGSSQFRFEGEVISTVTSSDNMLQSMVIRSTNFNGATFALSKITNPDGTVIYRGRIISFRHGDLYELQLQEGRYTLVKRNFYDLVNE